MEEQSTGAAVSAALDPVLEPLGFAAGQYDPVRDGQVIFCAAFDDIADRYPWLPQASGQPRGSTACVDLMVNTDAACRIASVEFETTSLERTLRSVGLIEAAERWSTPPDVALTEQLELLSATLRELLSAPR